VLRRALLAAAASEHIRGWVTATPATRAVVDRYVAGETLGDAVRVARSLREAGLLVTLDHLGEDTTDPPHASAAADQYLQLLGKLAAEGLTEGGAVEVAHDQHMHRGVGARLRSGIHEEDARPLGHRCPCTW